MTAPASADRAAASHLIAALEHAWTTIRSHHPDVPQVVIVVASGSEPRGKRLNLGHFAAGRWQLTDQATDRAEVLVSGEGLQRGPADVLGTLLHEAAHGLAYARKISDTSRQGRYHNRRYATLARELGLDVAHLQPIGWSATSVPDSTAARYVEVLAELAAALVLWRRAERAGPGGPGRSRNALACSCACGRRIRVARSVLELAPILCVACAQPFEPEDDRPVDAYASTLSLTNVELPLQPPCGRHTTLLTQAMGDPAGGRQPGALGPAVVNVASHRWLASNPLQTREGRRRQMQQEAHPVRFTVDYPDRPLDRLTTAFRIFVAIPILIVLGTVSGGGSWDSGYDNTRTTTAAAGGLLFLGPLLMILFRQKYPRWWFDWNLELQRFGNRVGAYMALMDDRYPATDQHQSVHLDYPYPDAERDLNRWLPLVKWLLAIPHYIVLFFLWIAALVVVIVAWFAILFTGRYPRGMFDFVEGVIRWNNRVIAYALVLVTDRYPPFRLTQ